MMFIVTSRESGSMRAKRPAIVGVASGG